MAGWFRLLPGMDWYSRIRSGGGVQRSREWNFFAGRDPQGSVRGCHRPTATRRVERHCRLDSKASSASFVAPDRLTVEARGFSRAAKMSQFLPDIVKLDVTLSGYPLTVVAGVMFRCALSRTRW